VPGTWSVVGPLTYAWLRDGRAIARATRATYRVVAADRRHHISCRVTDSPAGYTPGSTTTKVLLAG
jgi:hypothetical protein